MLGRWTTWAPEPATEPDCHHKETPDPNLEMCLSLGPSVMSLSQKKKTLKLTRLES